jgi:hypothetical protein
VAVEVGEPTEPQSSSTRTLTRTPGE